MRIDYGRRRPTPFDDLVEALGEGGGLEFVERRCAHG